MLLIIGRVARAHGIRGEVVVDVRTDTPDERFVEGAEFIADPSTALASSTPTSQVKTLTIASARPHQGRYLVRFEGFPDRSAVEALRGVLLCVDGDVVPSADPDDYHDSELIGLAAVDRDGRHLGEVVRIDHAPASDLLVVRRPDGGASLVPFVRAIVPDVDVSGGKVVLTPPDGLFDL